MSELKPCPFCGGEAILCKDLNPDGHFAHKMVYVECNSCGCSTKHYRSSDDRRITTRVSDAINAWNRRVMPNEESPLSLKWSHTGKPFGKVLNFNVETGTMEIKLFDK